MVGCWHNYRRTTAPAEKAIHFAAILGTLSLCLEMIPDNPVTAIFVMLPLAALIGVSRGLGTGKPPIVRPAASRSDAGNRRAAR